MNHIIDQITQFLLSIFGDARLVVAIISGIPIIEARLGIPFAIKNGLSPVDAFIFSFIGCTIIVPFVLLLFIPIVNMLYKIKLFRRVSQFVSDLATKKSQEVDQKNELSKFIGIFLFVAIPLPLTGAWMGSAAASLIKLSYPKSILAITLGNIVACTILVLTSVLFHQFINIIILVVLIIALIGCISLLLRFIVFKPNTAQTPPPSPEENNQ